MESRFLGENLPANFNAQKNREYFNGANYTREDIIKGNLRLVASIVIKYDVSEEDKKDLFQIGTIGLMKAVDSFDVSRETSFASYAITCINNEIRMFFRANRKHSMVISLEEPIYEDKDGSTLNVIDKIVDEKAYVDEIVENESAINLLKELVVSLSVRDSFIVSLYFGLFGNQEFSQKEIAFRLNFSQSYISRLITYVLKTLGVLISNPPKKHKRSGKKPSSIFKLLGKYDRKLVWEVINELDEEDRILLYLRCGRYLDNPHPSPFWNKNTAYKFNGKLLPKIKRRLDEKLYYQNDESEVEELSPREKYRREKITEIHNFLLSMDMFNAQISLHEYLAEFELLPYENFIISLIILSVMDKDFTFQNAIRNLVLLDRGYQPDIFRYKDYFYEALQKEFDKAQFYLDIVKSLNQNGNYGLDVYLLEKAYERVLKIKN